MSEDDILVRVEQDVCLVTLNRPDALNALTASHLRMLIRILLRAWRDDRVGSILITGAGRGFCAGHDLNGMDLGARGAGVWNDVFEVLSRIPKPTVAAVNGVAVGGGLHLALVCDLALCVNDAVLGESFVWIGACPDTGGHLLIQRSIGHQRAAELLLLGRKIAAREAAEAGLFMAALETREELAEEAWQVAAHLAKGPRLSYAVTRRGLEYARLHSTREVLTWEAEREEEMTKTYDMQEGVAAFLGKRNANFRGL